MNKSFIKKSLLAVGLAAGLLAALVYYGPREQGPIYEFQFERDTQPILKLFTDNWYWLLATPDDTEFPAYYLKELHFMLKHRAPQAHALYAGRLSIKTLRDNDTLAGFVTYHKDAAGKGVVQFLAVDSAYRGRGYGEQLMRYALDDLKSKGAKHVDLFTRTTNYAAQKIYNNVGMHETKRTDKFVYFGKDL